LPQFVAVSNPARFSCFHLAVAFASSQRSFSIVEGATWCTVRYQVLVDQLGERHRRTGTKTLQRALQRPHRLSARREATHLRPLRAAAARAVAVGPDRLAVRPACPQLRTCGSGDYLGSKSKDPKRSQALSIAASLDRYNNGTLC
jgi:hypothetical protein